MCCRHYPGAAAGCRRRSSHPAVTAFPENVVGSACPSSFSRLARRSLALRPAHSRSHLYVTSYTEGFSHFVASMTAPVASGWSVCRVGLAPTGTRRLLTAHTYCGHHISRPGGRSWAESGPTLSLKRCEGRRELEMRHRPVSIGVNGSLERSGRLLVSAEAKSRGASGGSVRPGPQSRLSRRTFASYPHQPLPRRPRTFLRRHAKRRSAGSMTGSPSRDFESIGPRRFP